MVGRFRDDSGVILDVWKKMSKIVIFFTKKKTEKAFRDGTLVVLRGWKCSIFVLWNFFKEVFPVS